MPDGLLTTPDALARVLVSGVVAYAALLAFTRVSGLRTFAKLSAFDFATTVAAGSVLAATMLTGTPSLGAGVAGLALLLALQWAVSRARLAFRRVSRALDNEPLLLVWDGTPRPEALRRARLTDDDLRQVLRQAGVTRLSDVRAVVFETTGDVSVIRGDALPEPWLLTGVRGAPGAG